ncbi:MAG: hypothetical protein M3Y08_17405 [Fibrobacterota bacterium]|nr:hypothetical protein [Fibrobacterota bacterium]
MATKLPEKLEETFSAILTLEELYFNEHGTYAPDLRTLRKIFQVKDSLEYLVPGYEIYTSIRDGKPLLFALDRKGDSLVQVDKGAPYFGSLNQSKYRVDSRWGFSRMNPLEIRIELPPGQAFKGVLVSSGKELCRFLAEGGKRNLVRGCPDHVEKSVGERGQELEIVISSTLLRAGPWEVILTPTKPEAAKGLFSSQGGTAYTIRGSISKKHPLMIHGIP